MAKLCYGCMKQKNNSPICEHCGYNENLTNYPHQLPIGTVLNGQYLIGKVLGQGGFGITYIGWDLSLETTVAIKEYYPRRFAARDCGSSLTVFAVGERLGDPFQHNRDRFIAEARIQAKLSDIPGVVQIQRLFEENNTAYIVMEYVRGINLKHYLLMSGRSLTPKETFAVIKPVMYAMEKVHETGLVHRDISPDNIMIQSDGTVKLLDFGAAYELGGTNVREETAEPTQAILKHGFAPIEQYNREGNIGPWTDVYALCATVYYCLTGTVPDDATERYLGNDNIDWSQISGLSAAQIAVLKRGLAIRPENRIATIRELRQGLFEQRVVEKSGLSSETQEIKTDASETEANINKTDQKPDDGMQGGTEEKAPKLPVFRNFSQKDRRKEKTVIKIMAAILSIVAAAGFFLDGWKQKETEELRAETTEANVSEALAETTSIPIETVTIPTEMNETFPMEAVIEEPAWEKNVLMADITFDEDSAKFWREEYRGFSYEIHNYFSMRPIFNTEIPRNRVTDVFFLDSFSTAPEKVYDVSANQDGSVLAWTQKNNKGALNLYIAGEGGVNGTEACRSLFYGYRELASVNFDNCFFTDTTQDMSNMFAYCKKLTKINLDGVNTANVTNMSNMFGNCELLPSLDLRSFDTANVIDMSSMFSNCLKLKSLDISSFDTSNTENMSYMFACLESMTSIDVSSLDTSNVINMSGLFYGCSNTKLTALDLSGFDTSKVTDMNSMFSGCNWIKELDLKNFDTSNVTDMQSMFSYCRRLISLDLSSFDTSNVTNMQSMFEMCSMLPVLEISHFDTAKVIDMSYMFCKCGYLEKMDVTKLDVTNVKNREDMFYGCDRLPFEYKKVGGKHTWDP